MQSTDAILDNDSRPLGSGMNSPADTPIATKSRSEAGVQKALGGADVSATVDLSALGFEPPATPGLNATEVDPALRLPAGVADERKSAMRALSEAMLTFAQGRIVEVALHGGPEFLAKPMRGLMNTLEEFAKRNPLLGDPTAAVRDAMRTTLSNMTPSRALCQADATYTQALLGAGASLADDDSKYHFGPIDDLTGEGSGYGCFDPHFGVPAEEIVSDALTARYRFILQLLDLRVVDETAGPGVDRLLGTGRATYCDTDVRVDPFLDIFDEDDRRLRRRTYPAKTDDSGAKILINLDLTKEQLLGRTTKLDGTLNFREDDSLPPALVDALAEAGAVATLAFVADAASQGLQKLGTLPASVRTELQAAVTNSALRSAVREAIRGFLDAVANGVATLLGFGPGTFLPVAFSATFNFDSATEPPEYEVKLTNERFNSSGSTFATNLTTGKTRGLSSDLNAGRFLPSELASGNQLVLTEFEQVNGTRVRKQGQYLAELRASVMRVDAV